MKAAFLLVGVLVAGSAYGFYRMQAPQDPSVAADTLVVSDSRSFTGPVNATAEQRAALRAALANNLPVPSEFTETEWNGKVKVVDLGEEPGSGMRDYIVTVRDEPADLQTATVFVNGLAAFTATRANGAIKDRNGVATATLSASAPTNQAFTGKVTWTANDGSVSEYEIGLP